ncbi:MAG: MerR family transcriptional regulator [Lachnospiraceae bacterium]|nr:MerR family transcriptional regulator [Lachnospiraceae bacterium]
MSNNFLISDAAKQVKVETHVLRYWEEELELPIKRNELGHRYYTKEDVERFMEIKNMKERGLQLKAIRMILKDGKLDMLPIEVSEPLCGEDKNLPAVERATMPEGMEDKAKRLQWILQQLFRETLKENNQELGQMIKEIVLKELDYQFRAQEEKEEERHAQRMRMDEEHFRKVDELLRKKHSFLKKKK